MPSYPSRPHATPRNPTRILLIEDDLDQAHLVKFLLEAGGDLLVTLVQDGDRALDLIEDRSWELLITDLNLPGTDGTVVVEFARNRHEDLPILATTGYTGPEYAQRAMEVGADYVLVKPLDRDELLEKVRELLEGGRPERAPGELPVEPPGEPSPRSSNGSASLTGDEAGPAPKPLQVLAIGVRPGDVESGCGGALLRHRARGDRVVILHLSSGDENGGVSARELAREAGRILGVRIFVGSAGREGKEALAELERLAGGAVREIEPDVLYLPSLRERSELHRIAHRAAEHAGGSVHLRLAYDSGTVGPEFAPTAFLPLPDPILDGKVGALAPYQTQPDTHLAADFVRAAARFWGRYPATTSAEAFEVLHGSLPFSDAIQSAPPDAAEARPSEMTSFSETEPA